MQDSRNSDGPTKTDYAALAEKLLGYPLPIDDLILQLSRVIAVGAFGVVFLGVESGQDKRTEKSYAVKCLLRNHYNPHADKFVCQETTNHSAVRHPNVVTLFRVVEHVDLVFIVMEYCPSGDLFKAIIERQEFVGQDDKVRLAWLQIAEGVRACHAQGVYHRDIKPENILIRSPANPALHLVLADFGLSTKEEWSFEFGVGSSYYMSPECFQKEGRGHKKQHSYSSRLADIWALGVVLINLSCGRNPWLRADPDEPTFASFCQDDSYLGYILPITAEFNDLLKRVFRINPSERIALDEFIDEVRRIDRFTLNYQELMNTSEPIREAAGPLVQVRWDQEMMKIGLPEPLENDGVAPEAALSSQSNRQESEWDGSDDDSMQFLKESTLFQRGGAFGGSFYSQASEGEEDAEEPDEELDDDNDDREEENDEECEAEYDTSRGADVEVDGTDLAQAVEIVDDDMSDTESIAPTLDTSWISPAPPSHSYEDYEDDQWDLFESSSYINLDGPDPNSNPPPLTTAPSIPSTPICGLVTPAQTNLYDDCGMFPPLQKISFADSAIRSGFDCPPEILDDSEGSGSTPRSIPHSTWHTKRRLYQTQCDPDIEGRHLRPQKVARGVFQRFAAEARCLSKHFPI